MKIKIINPVPDLEKETVEAMRRYLAASLEAGTCIEFEPVARGFRSIETEAQGVINGAEILRLVVKAQREDCDGIFINCFDDPALIGARELSRKPVLGPYGASVHFASMISEKVGIITTDDYGICCEERKALHYQFAGRIAAVEKVEMTVLDLCEGDLLARLTACCQRLEAQQIYAVVLGCTGMNFAADELKTALKKAGLQIQVIEPLKMGVKALELLIKMEYTNAIKGTKVRMEDYIE
ncbi:MAG: aspartate/glutamate racemase family protein [Emergencia timonensis]|uniref:aspartate/glutamate racemase family protein n=1 Tax=Emergencia timonensis TaxID=1776384 RepID=UPI000B200D59|nr:aspartate/glutamate racemase family protein [Emergencia timonensis]WNX89824.1 aspartate/glutamate racemase family protein [Emergencia timonensis]